MAGCSERRWAASDGLVLYARDYAGGDGEARLPVICLHGLTRNSKDFADIAPRIAATGRRVIVPDVRGRGLSARDPDPANYQPKTYARDVLGLMDGLGVGRAIFLGTSMGGLVTMVIAAARSKAVAAAILNDVGPEIAPGGVTRIMGYTGKNPAVRNWDEAADYLRRINGAAHPDFAERDWRAMAERTFRDGPDGPELDYDPMISSALSTPGRMIALVAGLLFRRLARRRPALLLRGELSDVITADISGRMQRAAPSLQVVVVPGVGHAPTLDEPVAVDAIAQFLRTVP